MASPHTFADMLQDAGGDLTASLFPHMDATLLETFLAAKLAEGYARIATVYPTATAAEKDAAAIAWAYSRAYLAVWQRLSASPAVADVGGEASRSYLASQIEAFKVLSDTYAARYEEFVPILDPHSGGGTHVITGVPTRYGY